MGCCCNNTKDDKNQSPDCMASKSTVVTTPEGEDVEVNSETSGGRYQTLYLQILLDVSGMNLVRQKDGKSEKGMRADCF